MNALAAVLEDDPEIANIVSTGLSDDGFDVVCCQTVQEFKDELACKDFDLLFVDISLPDGNGMDVVKDIKSKTSACIIFLTGRGDEIDQVVGFELGADDFIVKPFRIRELRARAKAVYRRVSRRSEIGTETDYSASSCQVFHGLELFRATRDVRRQNGEAVNLTTLEFDVLSVLASNLNRVRSRDQIIQQVSGRAPAATDRAVDGLISRLRSKLFPDGSGPNKIKTIRGLGYMMVSKD